MTSIPLRLVGLNDQDGDVALGPYVTLDWDEYDATKLDFLRHRVLKEPFVRRAWVRSSSRKGHHIILELDGRGWWDRASFASLCWLIRVTYLDDMNRVAYDLDRGDPVGIVFDWKRGRFSGDWERFKG